MQLLSLNRACATAVRRFRRAPVLVAGAAASAAILAGGALPAAAATAAPAAPAAAQAHFAPAGWSYIGPYPTQFACRSAGIAMTMSGTGQTYKCVEASGGEYLYWQLWVFF